jgi:single-strand selective monofunctional uracil DNA glycosylase
MPHPLAKAALQLRDQLDPLQFSPPVCQVYNPLHYAWAPHQLYLESYGASQKETLFLGMNPGPWGMAQTGVPFGEVAAVRSYLKIEAPVSRPEPEHPRRPIQGFGCARSEVSGRRLWGLFASRFPDPADFFASHFVANYCPLVFMEESGRNRTPDKLPAQEREAITRACDAHLAAVIQALQPRHLVGVGAYAEAAFRRLLPSLPPLTHTPLISRIPHPSPASPAANRGWDAAATSQLVELGIWQ